MTVCVLEDDEEAVPTLQSDILFQGTLPAYLHLAPWERYKRNLTKPKWLKTTLFLYRASL